MKRRHGGRAVTVGPLEKACGVGFHVSGPRPRVRKAVRGRAALQSSLRSRNRVPSISRRSRFGVRRVLAPLSTRAARACVSSCTTNHRAARLGRQDDTVKEVVKCAGQPHSGWACGAWSHALRGVPHHAQRSTRRRRKPQVVGEAVSTRRTVMRSVSPWSSREISSTTPAVPHWMRS